MKHWFKAAWAVVLVSGALAQEKKTGLPAGVTVNRDQVYAQRGERPLKLDLYRARDAEGRLPVVLWVHGGGWNQGSKDRCPAAWLAQKGFAVASVEYRLSTEARWPAQMEDCRDAVRWLRDHAAELEFDADHIGVWGGSAGGHLVALMGTLPLPEGEKTSARVQAVCDWYGPSDLLTMPPNVVSEKRSREQVEKSNGAILLGAPIMDVPELAKRCSAFHQVSAGDAPFLIMHGEKDPMVPLEQSEKLDAALRGAGVESELVIIPEGGHGGAAFQTDAVREKVQRFFDKHLRPGRDKAAPKS